MTTIKELEYRVSVVEAYCEGQTILRCPWKYVNSGNAHYSECDPGKYNWNWAYFNYKTAKVA